MLRQHFQRCTSPATALSRLSTPSIIIATVGKESIGNSTVTLCVREGCGVKGSEGEVKT